MNFIKSVTNPFLFKLFLIQKLPLAWIAGLQIVEINNGKASVGLKYGYFTKNPFKSLYFACLAMAAELSSGILVLLHVNKSGKSISTLVVQMEATFHKKATGKVIFHCVDGEKIKNTIEQAVNTNEGQTITSTSTGYNENNEIVANFIITWSVKVKSK